MKPSCLQLCQTSVVQAGCLAESELVLEVSARMLWAFPRISWEKILICPCENNPVTILLKSFNVSVFQSDLLKFSQETALWQQIDFCHSCENYAGLRATEQRISPRISCERIPCERIPGRDLQLTARNSPHMLKDVPVPHVSPTAADLGTCNFQRAPPPHNYWVK